MSDTYLLVTCHPSPRSLSAGVAQTVAEAIRARGDNLVVEDLYQLGLDAVLSPSEYGRYYEDRVPADLEELTDNLLAADALVFVFPIWMYGMPAMLKGYFDRVWRPHIAFELKDGRIISLMTRVRSLTVIATHGMTQEETDRVGDNTREFFAVSLPSMLPKLAANTRFDLYGLDFADSERIATELARIRAHFERG